MRAVLAFVLIATFATTSNAAAPVTTVEMSNFKFAPTNVQLQAGVPVVLHLSNLSGGGHSFSAPEFFAAARLEPQASALVHSGKVEVPAHSAIDLTLVPAQGDYPLKCTHTLHSSFGMKGAIVVRP